MFEYDTENDVDDGRPVGWGLRAGIILWATLIAVMVIYWAWN